MLTAEFDYFLPPELIAQHPVAKRDQSRLMHLDRASGQLSHGSFRQVLDRLRPGDTLVLNDSRVIPARIRGSNVRSGGQFELLLVEELGVNDWWAMLRPGKRARVGTEIRISDLKGDPTTILAAVTQINDEGHRRVRFEGAANIIETVDAIGEVPLPPYINRPEGSRLPEDVERYQTVFARPKGSVAAPTAGLHFTTDLLDDLRARGIGVTFVTLHVGLGTFAPVKAEEISAHHLHEERYELGESATQAISECRARGGRVIAVGTTVVRVLESVARTHGGRLMPGAGRTSIFIFPPAPFHIVDGLLTNFHLPRSTLLMLVSAFAAPGQTSGRDLVLRAYGEAVREGYRFFSYGDAMLIL